MFIRFGLEDVKVIFRDVGHVIEWSAISFLVPIIVSLIYQESHMVMVHFGLIAVLAFVIGYALRKICFTATETDLKHAFLSAGVLWIVYCGLSALPFVLITGMTFVDSFFESMSALTTTGLTVMAPFLDSAPKSLLFWRSLLSWIGGIGIIVMALVGVLTTYTKSSKLILAEGRTHRIKPHIKNTTKEIWKIYLLLTIVGVLLLYFSGMNIFESINYSMSAISTSGMDLTSTGLAGLNNYFIEASLIIIMLLGAIAFPVHYLFFKKKDLSVYFKDAEFKALIALSVITIVLIFPKMALFYGKDLVAIEQSVFHVVSSLTCGGFAIVPFSDVFNWDDFTKLLLVAVMFIGGSAGSTSGGIKLSRFMIFVKSIYWRIKNVILPKDSFFQRKFEGRVIESSEIREVTQFILLYALFMIIGIIVLTVHGNDLGNSLFEVVSAQSNAGISTGITHYGMPLGVEIMLILNMWIGRLEIIPVLAFAGFLLSLKRNN